MMDRKICTNCRIEWPATLEFFCKHPKAKDGLGSWCRECKSKKVKKWREENPEKRKKQQKAYKKKNWKKYLSLNNLHTKIRKLKPKQKYCSICNQEKKLELSSIEGIYTEDTKDYWWLCHECHHLYDRINKTHKEVLEE